MKEIAELHIPDDRRYAPTHEWVKLEGDLMRVGISDYAQDQLGDVVFVELPEVGATLGAHDQFGTVESVKAVSELYSPLSGEVVAINDVLEDAPETVNAEAHDGGWMIKVKLSDPSELDGLMSAAEYVAFLDD